MTTIRDVWRRLDVAEAVIRPANSFPARLKRLTTDDRETYEQWRTIHQRWALQFFEPDAMYAASLNGNHGPQLPDAIARQLFKIAPEIMESDNIAIAAEKYRRCLENL